MSKEKKSEKSIGPFEGTLGAIKGASEVLNRAADTVSVELEALEQELLNIEPGVSVWTDVVHQEFTRHVGPNGVRDVTRVLKLGFAKGKKGGLLVSESLVTADGNVVSHEEHSLRKVDRETRLTVRPHLAVVLDLILSTLNGQVARLPPVETPATETPAT